MSRPSSLLRDAALGYASRGIPVLPLHHPLPHRGDLQPVTGDRPLADPTPARGCSCRDPGCGQVGKHPLGSLVPHGLKEATTNRARSSIPMRSFWIRAKQYTPGPITCRVCGQDFQPQDTVPGHQQQGEEPPGTP